MGKSPFAIDPRIQKLHECKEKLDAWGQRKAGELVDSYARFRGKFTDKQWKFVESLISQASGTNVVSIRGNVPVDQTVPCSPRSGTSLADAMTVVGFAKIEEGLYKANKPFRLMHREWKITLTRGVTTRGANVKVNGDFVGVIRNEMFKPKFGDSQRIQVALEAICEYIKNPVEIAQTYGRKTGSCCFCGIFLTDPRSVKVGYGPICAGNYGLPWGEEVETNNAFEGVNFDVSS